MHLHILGVCNFGNQYDLSLLRGTIRRLSALSSQPKKESWAGFLFVHCPFGMQKICHCSEAPFIRSPRLQSNHKYICGRTFYLRRKDVALFWRCTPLITSTLPHGGSKESGLVTAQPNIATHGPESHTKSTSLTKSTTMVIIINYHAC
jgi:hypothetical protein